RPYLPLPPANGGGAARRRDRSSRSPGGQAAKGSSPRASSTRPSKFSLLLYLSLSRICRELSHWGHGVGGSSVFSLFFFEIFISTCQHSALIRSNQADEGRCR
ncbi:Os01g0608900, partial [Oryza sativa Japonica Group]